MKTVSSISGGKTSAFMAIHFPTDINIFACVCVDDVKCAPSDNRIARYCEEKLNGNFIGSAESEKTLKVLIELEQKIGKEIIWVRGKSYDSLIQESKCLPNWKRRKCTTELKIMPIFEYLYPRYGVISQNIGFRVDEAHRAYKKNTEAPSVVELVNLFGDIDIVKEEVKKRRKTHQSIKHVTSQNITTKRKKWDTVVFAKNNYPLIDNNITAKHVREYFSAWDFPKISNCVGCPFHKPSTFPELIKDSPNQMNWFSKQEKNIGHTWHDDKVPYADKIKMNYTELISFTSGSCDSGYCTD